jgi:hypothetical protein
MLVIIVALGVGLYLGALLYAFSAVLSNPFTVLWLGGFCKHFLGYLLGLHTWFCREAGFDVATANPIGLIGESMVEGAVTGVIGLSLMWLANVEKPSSGALFLIGFITGVTLHLLVALSGLHDRFVADRCLLSMTTDEDLSEMRL